MDNTVIVYTSDQGFYMGEHGWFDTHLMYEESFRTPLIIRYPAKIKAGSECTALVQNIDYAPTYLDIAGIEKPDYMVGTSLVPLFGGVTSMIVCMGLVVTGVLDWKTAFAGFVDSNVILFVAMFIVGGALFETEMANKIGGVVTHFAKSEKQLIIAIMIITFLCTVWLQASAGAQGRRGWNL